MIEWQYIWNVCHWIASYKYRHNMVEWHQNGCVKTYIIKMQLQHMDSITILLAS